MEATSSFEDVAQNYDPRKLISRPVLSKFERAKVIGMRMEQLSRGAAPAVPVISGETDIRAIALREFKENRLPFMLARSLPTGGLEVWRLADLKDIRA